MWGRNWWKKIIRISFPISSRIPVKNDIGLPAGGKVMEKYVKVCSPECITIIPLSACIRVFCSDESR